MDEAERACKALDDPTDAFGTCRKVISSKVYLENCKRDYCNAQTAEQKKEAICHSFSAMAAECADHYLVVEWRRADRCRKLKLLFRLNTNSTRAFHSIAPQLFKTINSQAMPGWKSLHRVCHVLPQDLSKHASKLHEL